MIDRLIRVLLVESQPDQVEKIKQALMQTGDRYTVRISSGLAEARDLLQTTEQDIVVCSWILPDGKGIDLLTDIELPVPLPVVYLTDRDDQSAAVLAVKSGAADCLVKSDYTNLNLPTLIDQILTNKEEAEASVTPTRPHRDSEERFHVMAATIQDGLSIVERGKTVFVNDQVCRIFGYPRAELMKMSGFEIAAPEEKIRLETMWQQNKEKDVEIDELDFWIIRKDGARRYIRNRYSVSSSGGVKRRFIVTTDLTARKQAEDRLKSILENLPDTVLYQTGGGVEYISSNVVKVLGYTVEEVTADRNFFPSLMHPDDKDGVGRKIQKWLASGSPEALEVEFRFLHRNGSYIWLLDRMVVAFRIPSGAHSYHGVMIDITQRKEAEMMRRESEARYKYLLENQGEGFILTDMSEKISLCNPAAEEIFGVKPGTLVGRNLIDFLSLEMRDIILTQTQQRRTGAKSTYEAEFIRPDGGKRTLIITASPWHDEDGSVTGTFGVFRDITDRKKVELEREDLIEKLQDALSKIKVLSGLIPICANCKKIRDDKGFWNKLEDYIAKHSETTFSHGICPECAKKLYPEYYHEE